MLLTSTLLALVVAAASPSLAAVATADGSITYSAVLSGSTVQITIKGPVAADGYIALGIPNQSAPVMAGADMYVAYPMSSGATVIEGAGANTGSKNFAASSTSTISVVTASSCDGYFVLIGSGYANGILTAVFTRPVTGGTGLTVADGQMAFLWATGKMGASGPTKHTAKGVIRGNIVGASTGAGVPVTTTPATGTKPSGAGAGVAGGWGAAVAGVAAAGQYY
ncbi:hypothetical protein HDU67_007322 [Dinochytrium kinnereticum]|nr:hypothetical protein HDU67_007322 [Dinochytrium kinnereticum]